MSEECKCEQQADGSCGCEPKDSDGGKDHGGPGVAKPEQPKPEFTMPNTKDLLMSELLNRVAVYKAKYEVFQAFATELRSNLDNLSEDSMTAVLHLLFKTKKDL